MKRLLIALALAASPTLGDVVSLGRSDCQDRVVPLSPVVDAETDAQAYVLDGLVHMWDAIENAGWGVHDQTLVGAVDLASWDGSGYDPAYYLGPYSNYSYLLNDGRAFSKRLDGQTLLVDAGCIPQTQDGCFTVSACGYFTGEVSLQMSAKWRTSYTDWMGRLEISYTRALVGTSYSSVNFNSVPRTTCSVTICATPERQSIYVDGELVAQGGMTSSGNYGQILASDYLMLGGNLNVREGAAPAGSKTNNGDPFYCNVMVYDRVLSAEEILYNHLIDKLRFGL